VVLSLSLRDSLTSKVHGGSRVTSGWVQDSGSPGTGTAWANVSFSGRARRTNEWSDDSLFCHQERTDKKKRRREEEEKKATDEKIIDAE